MAYINRTLEQSIEKISNFFPVIMVTGPRQVGKTTVLQNVANTPATYVSLDSLANRNLAQTEPELFLQRFPAPVLIDEIQYAPQLFPYIKAIVDQENKPGMYWLTGSQQFHLMKNVSESLAGRVGILHLDGFSQDEKNGNPMAQPFLPTMEYIDTKAKTSQPMNINRVYDVIWRGSYPKMHGASDDIWNTFYESYLQTYIERDVKSFGAVGDTMAFVSFMRVLAARTGQEMNYSDIARDIGVTAPTIKSWLSVLEASGLVFLLRPYYSNVTKRIIKAPKVYFVDTGLAAFLTGWNTPETLANGAMAGSIFETYVVSEIIKSYWYNGRSPNIYYYRDNHGAEIDVLIEENGKLYPVEIKRTTTPNVGDIKNFKVIEDVLHAQRGPGAVVCNAQTHLPLTADVNVIPVAYL